MSTRKVLPLQVCCKVEVEILDELTKAAHLQAYYYSHSATELPIYSRLIASPTHLQAQPTCQILPSEQKKEYTEMLQKRSGKRDCRKTLTQSKSWS
jgi:hypothetical protein